MRPRIVLAAIFAIWPFGDSLLFVDLRGSGTPREILLKDRSRLYSPARNPHYNDSNYRATVSLPGTTEIR